MPEQQQVGPTPGPCAGCGHKRDAHRDELGGICVGCPCAGYRIEEAHASGDA